MHTIATCRLIDLVQLSYLYPYVSPYKSFSFYIVYLHTTAWTTGAASEKRPFKLSIYANISTRLHSSLPLRQ